MQHVTFRRRSSGDNRVDTGGRVCGFLGLLTLLFIALKLTGVITWSWWWVLAPVWGWAVLVLLIVVAAVAVWAWQERSR